jgi:hypothetical protein
MRGIVRINFVDVVKPAIGFGGVAGFDRWWTIKG